MPVTRLAKLVGRAPATIYGLENGSGSGGTSVLHRIAMALGVRIEWLETGTLPKEPIPGTLSARDTTSVLTVHGMNITPDEAELGIEWGKLREPARSQIRTMIYTLVAEQMRQERDGKAKRGKDGERPGKEH